MVVTIYDENVEWVFAGSGTLNSADNTNPHTGLIDLAATAAHGGDNGTWTAPALVNFGSFLQLSLWLDPSGVWSLATSGVSFFWLDQTLTQQGNSITVQHGVYGFDANNKTYQNVIIPLSDFAVPQGTQVKALGMSVNTHTTLTFFLDTITLIPIMALSCDPSSLANAATCFSSCIPPGDQLAVQTYLLAQMALNVGAIQSADPNTLAGAAAGFMQTIPIGMQLAVQAYLLCQLVNK